MVHKKGISYDEFIYGKNVSRNIKSLVKNALVDTYQTLNEAKTIPDKDYQKHLEGYCSEVARHVDSILVSSGQLQHMVVDDECYVGFDKGLNWLIEHAPKGGMKNLASAKVEEYAKAIEGTETYESIKKGHNEILRESWEFLQRTIKKRR